METMASIRDSKSETSCAKCGEPLIAPEWSEFVSEGLVLNLWTCMNCGNRFETGVYMSAGALAIKDLKEEIERLSEPATLDEPDELLCCRMAMLGLDPYVIETGDRKTFDQIKRRCTKCEFREACAVDLNRDPNNPVWESYCPNSAALNTLTEAWWVSNVV